MPKKQLNNKKLSEKPLRSLVKSLSFRILVLLSDSSVVAVITGKALEVFEVVFLTNFSSTILYYIHERIWNRIHYLKRMEKPKDFHDEHIFRSLIKSLTFRVTVISSDLLITSAVTGSIYSAAPIIIFTNLFSTILYFLHERTWNKITWGKKNNPG